MHPHSLDNRDFGLVGFGRLGQAILAKSLDLSLNNGNGVNTARQIVVDTTHQLGEIARVVGEITRGFERATSVAMDAFAGKVRVRNNDGETGRAQFVDVLNRQHQQELGFGDNLWSDMPSVIDAANVDPHRAGEHTLSGRRPVIMAHPGVRVNGMSPRFVLSHFSNPVVPSHGIYAVPNPLVSAAYLALHPIENMGGDDEGHPRLQAVNVEGG